MPRDFKLPDLGEGLTEAEIVKVLVREGDVIAEDAPLLEVETDKAQVEIPSPMGGRVEKIHVSPGQTRKGGTVLVTFADDGAPARPAAAPSGPAAAPKPAGAPTPRPAPAPPPPAPGPAPRAAPRRPRGARRGRRAGRPPHRAPTPAHTPRRPAPPPRVPRPPPRPRAD